MRYGFGEFVSFYSNQVFETFSDYYSTSKVLNSRFFSPFSENEWWARLSVPEQSVSDQYYIYYYTFVLVLFVLYLFKRFLHLDQMGGAPKVHMITTSDPYSPQTSSHKPKIDLKFKKNGVPRDSDDGLLACSSSGQSEKPDLTTMEQIMSRCSLLKSVYKPTWFWGKSGHIQTLLFGVMQKPHRAVTMSEGKQYFLSLKDTSLVSFHVYEALKPHQTGEEVTLILCPGIFGDHMKSYIQSTIGAAIGRGYRVVCLNHLGVLSDLPLTTPRLFTYGSTEEYGAMCDKVFEMFPDSKFIAIGYSMGANQVCKYLGEKPSRQNKFMAAMSICQGYDCQRAAIGLSRWDKLQVLYSYVIAQRWISLVARHPLVMEAAAEKGINWREVRACRGLAQFDKTFSTKFYGFSSLEEFMDSNSCAPHLDNIHIPLLIINANDDPLIGPFYHDIPQKLSQRKNNVAFVETEHGGHLGYFESGMFFPREVWIDNAILQFCDSAALTQLQLINANKNTPSANTTSC